MNKRRMTRLAKANARRKKREAKFRERENRKKEERQNTSKQKHPTPLRPSELASLRPDKDIPWCTGCRAHTRYETVWKWHEGHHGEYGGAAHYKKPVDRCRRCNAAMATPAQLKTAEQLAWFVLPMMLLVLGPPCNLLFAELVGFTVHINDTVLLVWVLILLLTPMVLGPAAWFGLLSFNYRRWLKWAKEQKGNEIMR